MTQHSALPVHHGLVNVSLGAMQREYIPLLMPGVNDPEVTKGVLVTPPVTLEEEYMWYDGLAKRKNEVVYAILLHERDAEGVMTGYRYIGHTGLHRIRYPDGTATTGSLIIDKTCFGKGYGTEAKLLLLATGFHDLGLRKVNSSIKVFNGNSHGHLLACGYREIGRRKRQHLHEGWLVDEILFDVFSEDFGPIWQAYKKTSTLPRLTAQQRKLVESDAEGETR